MTVRKTRRKKIDDDTIFEAALQLIEEQGLDALSMRRLASRLGIGTMTLYGYAKSKEDLVDRMINYALQGVDFGITIDGTKINHREQLTSLALQLHKLSLSHSAIVEMLILTTFSCSTFNHFRNSLMGLLLNLGLSKEETVNASMAITSYTLGFAIIKKSRVDNSLPPAEQNLPLTIDEIEYPHMAALEKERHTDMPESSFLYGLNKLLDSILK